MGGLETVGFIILTTLALASAVVVVFHRSPVISALALAFNLVSIAGFYLLLNAQFLALLQVIVYAGAIMVLILFVIMLLSIANEPGLHRSGFLQTILAPLIALGCAVAMGLAVYRGADGPAYVVSSTDFGTVRDVGTELFSTFFYAFEAISLLLVVAMVGAVLLAKRRL
ncbi:MAG: NADH-quinone oxidoreductase subunit J [Acidobacteria bacterium]|nr:NADH-quinone oxidoreductase subunit J [Acidobacteriota bacterium]NIM64327.1 NADH-quinone oxidoreductase subunit J [Acidobacteriota bacterium]NIQ84970.1 NADH-quinone oxidoreductase subunit J [Acidobacteriota bacterium]NIT10784.1 NADH-quinone oxidoreductase subunit J [Acidobacteriota bacterium]